MADAEDLLGVEAAASLRQVLADLRAASALFDLPDFDRLPDGEGNAIILPIKPSHRLVLRCGNRAPPRLQDGRIDWAAVDRLKVMEIATNGKQ